MTTTITSVFGPKHRKAQVGKIIRLAQAEPLVLECGTEISDIPMAYQTYGTLNKTKDNAILICHGLTGDQYIIGPHPVTGKPGWWESVVGSGKIIDTDRFFVICSNVIGGCMGSWGPKDTNPATNKPYNLDFPVITIRDMVRAEKLLIQELGIDSLHAIVGGSMGAMRALEWSVSYPDSAQSVCLIAGAARHTAQNIGFHEIGRQAIMADPDWAHGRYLEEKTFPVKGLSIGRMTAHVTYLSESALERKFGRGLQDRDSVTFGFDADFQVESYLRYQGISFVDRFDPNSYLYITRAMDYFDLIADHGGHLAKAFEHSKARFCVISFSSDWLFPTSESKIIVHALNAAGAKVSAVEIETDKGHDAFLLDEPEFFRTLKGFVEGKLV